MKTLQQRLDSLGPERLRGMRRGLEKESLRALPDGKLALTPHPAALGSALTHPHITTDYSESQLELITGVHASVDSCLAELREVHQFTARSLRAVGDEMLWASSMPCGLPTDETIPLGRYGGSNVGRAKSVYRMGLGHRYGRRMQTISGIHYNWSLPGVDNDGYFALIRNFRRHAFLLLTLFGASPALCSTFVEGRQHELQPLGGSGTLHMPHGTSLRMGRLGYQSEAQATLDVSYNGLEGYAASLHDALTRPWPAYEAVGIRNPGGDYNQLATTLLQIENEFYGTIRPKRVIFPGERPLHALRERGVEYIEVRLMDLNPFEPIGIDAATLRFLDVFLLHCLLSDSPPDTPDEIHELADNQRLTAARGREPGLQLSRAGQRVGLQAWGLEIIDQLAPIAQALDAQSGGQAHRDAVAQARAALQAPETLPSARVLAAIRQQHSDSFVGFVRHQSLQTHQHLLDQPWTAQQQARYEAMSEQSVRDQQAIEAADSLPFEIYRQEYVSPARLGKPRAPAAAAPAAVQRPAVTP
jgi:glutamate--cysteine ligase